MGWEAGCGWAVAAAATPDCSLPPLPHAAKTFRGFVVLLYSYGPGPGSLLHARRRKGFNVPRKSGGLLCEASTQRNKLRSAGPDAISRIELQTRLILWCFCRFQMNGHTWICCAELNDAESRVGSHMSNPKPRIASIGCRCHRTVWRAGIIDRRPFRRSLLYMYSQRWESRMPLQSEWGLPLPRAPQSAPDEPTTSSCLAIADWSPVLSIFLSMEPSNRPFQNASEADWRRTESHTTFPRPQTSRSRCCGVGATRTSDWPRGETTADLAALRLETLSMCAASGRHRYIEIISIPIYCVMPPGFLLFSGRGKLHIGHRTEDSLQICNRDLRPVRMEIALGVRHWWSHGNCKGSKAAP